MRRQINVLVVLVVLMLVGGLVMAAVPRVQNAAARMKCGNNLKQLGLALHNYSDTFDGFPAATVPDIAPPYRPGVTTLEGLPPERRLSWITVLVPYVEQMRVIFDLEKAWDSEENNPPRLAWTDDNKQHREEPLGEWKVLLCPSNPSKAEPGLPCQTHYVGMAGLGSDAASRSEGACGVGVFGHDRRTRHEDIKDGSSTTMMVIETTARNGPWTAGGHPTVRGVDPSAGAYLGASGQFGSNHDRGDLFALTPPSVSKVLFADGSVRGLAATIRPGVFEALATIAGGEEVVEGADW